MSSLSKQTNLYITLNYTKPYEESFQRNLVFSQPLVRWFIKEFCANLANFVTFSKVTNYFFGLIDAKLVRESFKSIFQFSHLLIRWLIKELGANFSNFSIFSKETRHYVWVTNANHGEIFQKVFAIFTQTHTHTHTNQVINSEIRCQLG